VPQVDDHDNGVLPVLAGASRARSRCGTQRLEDYAIGFPPTRLPSVRLNIDSAHYSEAFQGEGPARAVAIDTPGDGLPASAVLTLPAYSVLILSPESV